jgi:two-component system, NarL family, sensor histidine kinase DesK
MATSPGEDMFPRAARSARLFAVVLVCLVAADRITDNIESGDHAQLPFTAALLMLPVLFAVPRTRGLVSKYRWTVLTMQAALTVTGFAVFGRQWQWGIDGLLAGLVLLLVPGRRGWGVAGGLLVSEVTVRAVLGGNAYGSFPGWYSLMGVAVFYLDDALTLFGPMRLARTVDEIDEARDRLADLAVSAERLRVARSLQTEVGDRVAEIAAVAAGVRRELAASPAWARARMAAAGRAAREMTARAKMLAVDPAGLGDLPSGWAQPGAALGARLAWLVLVASLAAYSLNGIADADVLGHYDAWLFAVTVTDTVLAALVHLYHSRAAIDGRRPRAWPVTLAVQAVLAYAFMAFGGHFTGWAGVFLATSVLLLIQGRWRWVSYTAVLVSMAVLFNVFPAARAVASGPGVPIVSATASTAAQILTITLLAYSLTWLAAQARRLEELRTELARLAVARERLRVARDVHDLLGLGLAAVALKADLIGRLIGRDEARAVAQIEAMSVVCASIRSDIRLVTGEGELSLTAELAADRDILSSAGIVVSGGLADGACLGAAGAVLVPVLREAVTNVLRHSEARACSIEIGPSGSGLIVLRVRNDGVPAVPGPPAVSSVPGHGLANSAARVQVAGGRLSHACQDGWFTLTAEVPLVGTDHSQPVSAAMRTASIRLRAPSLVTAAAR